MTEDQKNRILRTAWQSTRAALVAAAIVVIGSVTAASYALDAVDWVATLSVAGGMALVALLTTGFALQDNRHPVESE